MLLNLDRQVSRLMRRQRWVVALGGVRFDHMAGVVYLLGIRSHPAAPLQMPNGAHLGKLRTIDAERRAGLGYKARRTPETVARRAMAAFELHRKRVIAVVDVLWSTAPSDDIDRGKIPVENSRGGIAATGGRT